MFFCSFLFSFCLFGVQPKKKEPYTTFHSAPYMERRLAEETVTILATAAALKRQDNERTIISDAIFCFQQHLSRSCSLHLAIHTMLLLISTWLITPCYLIIGVCCRDKCVLTRCCCCWLMFIDAHRKPNHVQYQFPRSTINKLKLWTPRLSFHRRSPVMSIGSS